MFDIFLERNTEHKSDHSDFLAFIAVTSMIQILLQANSSSTVCSYQQCVYCFKCHVNGVWSRKNDTMIHQLVQYRC